MCGFRQPFGYCWANGGTHSSMSALSETPEMASSHCSFGSDPPRKSLRSGCEIILHVLKPPFLMWGSPRPCGWLVVATGTSGQAPGGIQPVVTPHPKEWGLAWGLEQGEGVTTLLAIAGTTLHSRQVPPGRGRRQIPNFGAHRVYARGGRRWS